MVLVTGSNGFVGSHLCAALERSDIRFLKTTRNPLPGTLAVGSISGETDWSEALQGVDIVVHVAGRVHMLKETSENAQGEFQKVNVEGTLNLARQAAESGVSRFVFISSIAVHGLTSGDRPFSSTDIPNPHDAYGRSKYKAEQGLKIICAETGMDEVIIRPPLVYGAGVGANFLRLMKLAKSAIPLPLGAVNNLRSPVFVGNLCDLIQICLTHPAAIGQTFLVSDNRDLSTPELLRMLAGKMEKSARLFPVPESLLRFAGLLIGRSGEIARLCGSLQLDISHTMETLGWTPPFPLEAGIGKTVMDYLEKKVPHEKSF